jgi:hypothetical protein
MMNPLVEDRRSQMIAWKAYAQWIGWGGTTLFLASWLCIDWISTLSFLLCIALMLGGGALCVIGAIFRSRWFLLPAVCAILVAVLVSVAAVTE